MAQITNQIFDSYFDCPFKSHLITTETKGIKHDLERFNINRIQEIKKNYINKISGRLYRNDFNIITSELLQKEFDYIFDIRFILDFGQNFISIENNPTIN